MESSADTGNTNEGDNNESSSATSGGRSATNETKP
jgi:hypothetical protein